MCFFVVWFVVLFGLCSIRLVVCWCVLLWGLFVFLFDLMCVCCVCCVCFRVVGVVLFCWLMMCVSVM